LPARDIVVGVTAGDPAGIGPEVACRALLERYDGIVPVLICREEVVASLGILGRDRYRVARSVEEIADPSDRDRIALVSPESDAPVPRAGAGTAATGAESLGYVDTAIELWRAGAIDAIVTGPVSKALIEQSGHPFTGHTEYIAAAINETTPYMLMYSDELRVLLVTTHLPIEAVARAITMEKIYDTIMMGHASIAALDGRTGAIAVTGLDPHCGDAGAIGAFDERVTRPAIERARREGVAVEGPFPADTIFMPGKRDRYALIVAHYHDQGLIPFKMTAFENGVNVTLGLSVVRTSVDHGTAFDIAGTGVASCRSMVQAISLAGRLARDRKKA